MNFLKRTVPLMITAGVGFVLIVASFIPVTEGWGEVAAVWFDILAAVAFILGGGNLLKTQLKKISDQAPGWGYAMVTLVAFLVTLIAGLLKVGAPPVENQEFYGQVFVSYDLEELPESQTFRVPGEIPRRKFDDELPASVRRQFSEDDGQLVFQGWIRDNQVDDLKEYNTTLDWLASIERLKEKAQPPKVLKGKIAYLADHSALALTGPMTEPQRQALLEMDGDEVWESAVKELAELSHRTVSVEVTPPLDFEVPQALKRKEATSPEETAENQDDEPEEDAESENSQDDPGMNVAVYDAENQMLSFTGPMSTDQRDLLLNQFPLAPPMPEEERAAFRQELESLGEPMTEKQVTEFNKVLDGIWTADQLADVVNAAGVYLEKERTAAEHLQARDQPLPARAKKPDATLIPSQVEALKGDIEALPPNELAKELTERLNEARPENSPELNDAQTKALEDFLTEQPTVGERNRAIYFTLLRNGPVSPEQKEFLVSAIQAQTQWQGQIVDLFQKAHQIKYPWSGDYREQGTLFWWMYEYLFKPLTATMFALLAFYVASAAFRAFRAKNVEASLLLGTAFIILLGRTAAGVLLTSWMPEALSGLRIENLAVYIMQVFNTAGNRAIMIGIALGIASTSLKVLLGIDRSYLGSQEES